MTLFYVALAWAAGIVLVRSLSPPPYWLAAISIACLACLALPTVRRHHLACALAVTALLGGWRMAAAQPRWGATDLATYNGRGPASVWGYISADPSMRDTHMQIEVSAYWLDVGMGPQRVRGRLVFSTSLYPERHYGERVLLVGNLETPPILDTFSYREYLAARGVYTTMRRPTVTTLPGLSGSPVLGAMYRIRAATRAAIEATLPGPEAGLLQGIILGQTHTLPAELADAFRMAGLSHIIVISGYNIGLVAQAIIALSRRWAHRWASLVGSLAAIGLFTAFVGPSAPVVRAAWMAALAIIARLLGRRSHALTSLAASSLAMTMVNPLELWSVSFQLSFVSTLGLIALLPRLTGTRPDRTADADVLAAHPRLLHGFRDLLLATIAAQMATLPLIWAHFGHISLLALPANLLVLPLQPAIMALGAASTALGALAAPVGRVAGWLVWPLLRFCIVVVRTCAQLPGAAIGARPPHPALIWLIYGGIVAVATLGRRTPRADGRGPRIDQGAWRWAPYALPLFVALVVLACYGTVGLPDGRLHLYVLDVGQGNATVIRLPRGAYVLVDGGPDPTVLKTRLGDILPFWRRRIDLVIATHADADHLTGLVPLIGQYDVGGIVQGPMSASALTAAWQQALVETGLESALVARGTRLALGSGAAIEVLGPPVDWPSTAVDDNAASVVLRLTMGHFAALLTADANAASEGDWLARGLPLRATALLVAHHGSAGGTTEHLLRAVDPLVAVISVGADNRFGHPSAEVLRRLETSGAEIYRTDRDGTVELITDGERLWVRSHPSGR